ncbi:hypothetical protein GCM10027290_49490 [Micromonospora sonneratiae]|jgi:WXG100 family type VII secretion target|uniref:WXG100 family type VII secretion target n=1 Tax=Micromonospora sonneratiae TaxID=1184706 RepID=A0ABW3YL10_9ACTN
MTAQFQTDIEFMSAGAKYVDNLSEKLREDLTGLMGRLDILQTEWQGRSGFKFDDLKVQFNAKLQTLYGQLQQLASIVDGNAQAYGMAQQDQLFQLEEVESMIGGSAGGTGGTNITVVLASGGQ